MIELGDVNVGDGTKPVAFPSSSSLRKGMTVEEIARERNFAFSTIYGHFARLVAEREFDADRFVSPEKIATIRDYFESTGDSSLGKAREVLGVEVEFWELRIVLAEFQRDRAMGV